MIVVEHNKIELDYCTSCQGVWFDSGELELFLNSMSLDSRGVFLGNILSFQEVQSTEKKRKCPICNKKMKKTIIGKQPEILIDVCQRGDGLWFDSGEVASLVKQVAGKMPAKEDSQQQTLGFLGEVFKAHE
jgi:Zn-finger nucleic acid-binding protein